MSGKLIEFGIRIQADGSIAVTEAGKVKQAFVGVGVAGKAAGESAAAGMGQATQAAGALGTQLANTDQKQKQIALSAGEMRQALRGVPMQFTDIATSLAAGQSPMQVFLQQGGQLKDMFGGVGPAARALGGYVAGLVTPLTVGAAAAAGLAVAFEMGRRESEEMAKSLILSGNAAGATVGQMQNYARTVAEATGATRGAVADVLTQAVASGKVGSEMLGKIADAAIRMERAGGPAAEETAKQFAELGKAPVEASLKLNEQTNYLTASVYRQIKALAEQGDTAGAAALAQAAYADAISERAPKLEQNLGALQRAWRGVADEGKRAWDAMLAVGRQETLDDKIKAVQAQLANEDWRKGSWGNKAIQDTQKADLEMLLKALNAQAAAEAKKAKTAGDTADQFGRQKRTLDDINTAATHQVFLLQKQLDDAKSFKPNTDREREDQARRIIEINQQIEGIRRGMNSRQRELNDALADARIQSAEFASRRVLDVLKREHEQYRLSTGDYLNTMAAVKANAIGEEIAALEAKLGAAGKESERIPLREKLRELKVQLAAIPAETSAAFEDAEAKAREALERLTLVAGKSLDPLTQAGIQFGKDFGATMQKAAVDGREDILEAGRTAWEAMAGQAQFAAAKQEYDTLFAELRERLDAVRQEAERDGGWLGGINAARKAEEIRGELMPAIDAAEKKLEALAGKNPVNAKTVADSKREFNRLVNEVDPIWKSAVARVDATFHDAFAHMLDKGESSWAAFTKSLANTFKVTVADAIYQFFARQFIFQAVAGVSGAVGLNGMANAAANVGGAGSALGGMGNLYSAGSNAYGLFSAGSALGGGSLFGIASGAEYGTAFLSQQSLMLAAQEATGATAALLSTAADVSAMLAAIPGWGWAAAAGIALLGSGALGGIFGGDTTSSSGINVGVRGTSASGSQYTSYHQDGGWFGSDSNWTNTAQVAMGDLFGPVRLALLALSKETGADLMSNLASFSASYSGAASGVNDWIKATSEQMLLTAIPGLEQFKLAGEDTATALARLAGLLTSIKTTGTALDAQIALIGNTTSDSVLAITQAVSNYEAINHALTATTDVATRIGLEGQLAQAAAARYQAEKKWLGEVADTLKNVVQGVADARTAVGQSINSITGTAPRTVAELRAAIAGSMSGLNAPSMAGLTNAAQIVEAARAAEEARGSFTTANAASDLARSTYQSILADPAKVVQDWAGHAENVGAGSPFWAGRPGDNIITSYTYSNPGGATVNYQDEWVAARRSYEQAFGATVAAYRSYLADLSSAGGKSLDQAQASYIEAQEAYGAAIRQFAGDAATGVDRLKALREETLSYYQAQQQLASQMGASSSALGQTLDDLRRSNLTPGARYTDLRSEFDRLATGSSELSGAALAERADRLNALVQPLMAAAQESYASGAGYQDALTTVSTTLGDLRTRLDATAPTNYQAESVSLLSGIDTALGLIQTNLASADQQIVAAINASKDDTVSVLRDIRGLLSGEGAALPGHADGLAWVPYDGYRNEAHYGEAIIDRDTMAGLRKYGIPVTAGASSGSSSNAAVDAGVVSAVREMTDRLVAAVRDGHGLLERIEEATTRTGRQMAGAVEAKARA